MIISVNNKKLQEKLQEIRNPDKSDIRYRRRKQEEKEATRLLEDELKRLENPDAPVRKVY